MPNKDNEIDYYGTTPAASFPTHALPGTNQKIQIMALRASLRQNLFHPKDAKITDAIEKKIRQKADFLKNKYKNKDITELMKLALEEVSEELTWEKLPAATSFKENG